MSENEKRWTRGMPSKFGHYDCKLRDGRVEIVKYCPGGDSELHPEGELIDNGEVVEYRRIPGIHYR